MPDDILTIRLEADGAGDREDTRDRVADSPHERADERATRIARTRAQRQARRAGEPGDEGDAAAAADDASVPVRRAKSKGDNKAKESIDRLKEIAEKRRERGKALAQRSLQIAGDVGKQGGGSAVVGAGGLATSKAQGVMQSVVGNRLASKVMSSGVMKYGGRLAGGAAVGYMAAKGGTEIAATVDQLSGGDSADIEGVRREIAELESYVKSAVDTLIESVGKVRKASLTLGGDPALTPLYNGLSNLGAAQGEFDAFMERREGVIRNKRAGEQWNEWINKVIGQVNLFGKAAQGSAR